MSTPSPRTLIALLCGCALLIVPAVATAASRPADVRVVAPQDTVVAEHTQYTDTVRIKTKPGADCFGQGTGGSGDTVRVEGATALGIVADGLEYDDALRPLSVTDAFDFGLGVCGIGGYQAPSTGYWYLKVNHVGSQTGGDLTDLKRGDDVLWHLIEDFNDPVPAELGLRAPARAESGEMFTAKVVAYADNGTRTPAEGAMFPGVPGATDSNGEIELTANAPGTIELIANRGNDIRSNTVEVCVAEDETDCPAVRGREIAGSTGVDEISGGKGRDDITALEGADVVDIAGGANGDDVACGGGRDKLIAERGQRFDARSCERVVRR